MYMLLIFLTTFYFHVWLKPDIDLIYLYRNFVIPSSHSWYEVNCLQQFYVSTVSLYHGFAPMIAHFLWSVCVWVKHFTTIFRVFWSLIDLTKHSFLDDLWKYCLRQARILLSSTFWITLLREELCEFVLSTNIYWVSVMGWILELHQWPRLSLVLCFAFQTRRGQFQTISAWRGGDVMSHV